MMLAFLFTLLMAFLFVRGVWRLLSGCRRPAPTQIVVVVGSADSFCRRCGTRLVIGNRYCTRMRQGYLTGDGGVAQGAGQRNHRNTTAIFVVNLFFTGRW